MSVGEIFVHFDPPKSGSRIVIYEGSCVLITIPRKKTMDRACQVAGAVAPLRCPRHFRFVTVSGVCNPCGCADSSFREVVVSGMQKVTFCLRAVAVFGCGA